MQLIDYLVLGIVCILICGALYLIFKNKGNRCNGCHQDCHSCNNFKDLYDQYQKDHGKD